MTLLIRHYLSGNHIQASAQFARLCKGEETAYQQDGDLDAVFARHRSYALGAVIMSVAFLEAVINEIFADATQLGTSSRVPDGFAKPLATAWEDDSLRRGETLGKYEAALDTCGCIAPPKGRGTWQEAKMLFDLRNALVHFTPETQMSTGSRAPTDPRHPLESALLGRFPECLGSEFKWNLSPSSCVRVPPSW